MEPQVRKYWEHKIKGKTSTGLLSKMYFRYEIIKDVPMMFIFKFILSDEAPEDFSPFFVPVKTFKGKTLYYQEFVTKPDSVRQLSDFNEFCIKHPPK